VPFSAEARARRAVVAGLLVVLGVNGCGSGAEDSADAPEASNPAASGSPSDHAETPAPQVSVAEVADLVDEALAMATRAEVRIQSGTIFTFDGTVDFQSAPGAPRSLTGRVDFRASDDDSSYEARDLRVSVTVPPGVDFPEATTADMVNQWGPAMIRIDPGVVAVEVRKHGIEVVPREVAEGSAFLVKLEGPATLTNMGFEPSPDMPDEITYAIVLDADGRLVKVQAVFGRYGADSATFADWR
jgi:hypothetical protein